MHFYQIQLFIKGRLFFEKGHTCTCCDTNDKKANLNYNINTKKTEMWVIMIIASIKNGTVVWTINLDFEVFVPDYSL